MNVAIQNDNYTKLGEFTKAQLEKQLKEILVFFLTREDVNSLIDEFEKEYPDAKTSVENQIIEKLVIGDSFTNYAKEHGSKPVCNYDKSNDLDVKKVSKKYRAYANKLPSTVNTNIDKKSIYEQKIIEILSTIFEGCKTSGDYITRLVNRRINALSPELKSDNDSTRMLIFKQALKVLGFPRNAYLSPKLTEYICEVTGISEESSDDDITKAISLLTDDPDNAESNIFAKLNEICNIISDAKKEYDKLVSEYKEITDEYKIKKKEYEALSNKLSNDKKTAVKDKEKAEEELNKAQKKETKIKRSIERDEKELEAEKNTEKLKRIEERMLNAKAERIKAENKLIEKTAIFEEASERLEKIESEYNDSKYITLKKDYESLAAQKEDISKKKNRVKNIHKDIQKEYNKNWAPLIWADDLGRGYFNDQQTTRRKIYWFAIIFDMTFHSGATNEIIDPETDIQKNLFYDFYADNLLNNLLIEDTTKLKKIEKEPSGHGINFKNYAEVIYLYYLSKHDLTPLQKMLAAEEMIDRCKDKDCQEIDSKTQQHTNTDTWLYQSKMKKLLSINVDDKEALFKYIKSNYICGSASFSIPTRVASNSKRPANVYSALIDGLKRKAREIEQSTEVDQAKGATDDLVNVDEKIECASIAAKKMIVLSQLVKDTLEHIDDNELKALLKKIDNKFHCVWKKKSIEECIDAIFIPHNNPEEDVSRTRMIVLYYFIIGLQYFDEGFSVNDFKKFYDDFCENEEIAIIYSNSAYEDSYYIGLNHCLDAAGYQEINPKNIFDITVIFFAYKKFMDISNNY